MPAFPPVVSRSVSLSPETAHSAVFFDSGDESGHVRLRMGAYHQKIKAYKEDWKYGETVRSGAEWGR